MTPGSTSHTLVELATLLGELPGPLHAHGRVSPREAPVLRLADGLTVSPSRRRKPEEQLAPLLARLAPAPVGKGRRTVVDPAVRRALHLKARDGAFRVEGFDPEASGVLREVRSELLGDAEAPLVAELDALHVYRPGDHFRAHKDTPRSTDAIGSLVVALPVRFTGGALRLSRGRDEDTIDLDRPSGPALPWVAFFGDVDHAVEPVETGLRVTLTYTLRAPGGARPPAPGEAAQAFERRLAEALRDPGFLPAGGPVRFPCAHLYPFAAEGAPGRRVDAEVLATLKGRDRDVAAGALRLELPVQLVACLVTDSGGWYRLLRLPSKRALADLPAAIIADDLVDLVEVDEAFVGAPLDHVELRRLFERTFSSTGYLGNEASEETFYLGCALDVTVAGHPQRVSSGRRVTHARFGGGKVLEVLRRDGETILRIRFDDGSERTIQERFVKGAV